MNDLGNTESSTGFLDKTLYFYFFIIIIILILFLVLPAYVSPHSPPYSLQNHWCLLWKKIQKCEIFFLYSFLFYFF